MEAILYYYEAFPEVVEAIKAGAQTIKDPEAREKLLALPQVLLEWLKGYEPGTDRALGAAFQTGDAVVDMLRMFQNSHLSGQTYYNASALNGAAFVADYVIQKRIRENDEEHEAALKQQDLQAYADFMALPATNLYLYRQLMDQEEVGGPEHGSKHSKRTASGSPMAYWEYYLLRQYPDYYDTAPVQDKGLFTELRAKPLDPPLNEDYFKRREKLLAEGWVDPPCKSIPCKSLGDPDYMPEFKERPRLKTNITLDNAPTMANIAIDNMGREVGLSPTQFRSHYESGLLPTLRVKGLSQERLEEIIRQMDILYGKDVDKFEENMANVVDEFEAAMEEKTDAIDIHRIPEVINPVLRKCDCFWS